MAIMSREELERAAKRGMPVLYEDRARGYKAVGQIGAIIDRYRAGSSYLQVELKDVHANSVCICDPTMISLWDGSVDKPFGKEGRT